MAYLVRKSRKRGGAYKKSRYAKRRMTGSGGFTKWMTKGNYYYTCNEDLSCCKWGDTFDPNITDWFKFENVRTNNTECRPYNELLELHSPKHYLNET